MDTPPAGLTDVEIETLSVTVAQRYAEALISKLAHKLATVEAKEYVNTLADTLPERSRPRR